LIRGVINTITRDVLPLSNPVSAEIAIVIIYKERFAALWLHQKFSAGAAQHLQLGWEINSMLGGFW